MTEKKVLIEEELDKVAGGSWYDNPSKIVFVYEKGFTQEICDRTNVFHTYTHRATITKRGYAYIDNSYLVCYYFDGDPDVAGWYPEYHVGYNLENNELTNTRIDPSKVTVVD